MKVAFLAYEYPPYSFGGISSFSNDLSLGLSLQGIKITVVSLSYLKTTTRTIINPNLEIIRVPTFNFPPRHLWWQTGNYNLIVELLKNINPDIIHSNNLVATLPLRKYRRISNVPQVVTVHGYNKRILEIIISNNKKLLQPNDFFAYVFFEPIYDFLLNLDIKNSDCVVSVAKHLENDLKRRFHEANLATIYNGVSIDPILKNQIKTKKSGKPIKIIYTGRLFYTKGITFAMQAYSYLIKNSKKNNIQFYIFGDGPLRTSVKKFEKLNKSVHYGGCVPRYQILNEVRDSDIVIFPSLYEACPIALLEALSLGKTVVVNKVPWSEEFIVDGVNGLRIDTSNAMLFADVLLELINNEGLRDKLSENAAKDIEKYSLSRATASYIKVYNRLMK